MILSVDLPYPPSVNHYWVRTQKGMTISSKGKQFARDVAAIVMLLRAAKLSTARLCGEFVVCPPDRRKRDIDNVLKALLDALCKAGVFLDDEQFDRLVIERGGVVQGGCVSVKISEVAQ